MIDAREGDVPREGYQLAVTVTPVLPACRPSGRFEAQREMPLDRVDLVSPAKAGGTWEVVIGVRAIVTAGEVVPREGIDAGEDPTANRAQDRHDDAEREGYSAPTA